ncbi:MAG: hypothetical protein FWF07_01950 [Methanomassiliicoccaceae archaeon]|nr:hypothetical protein [Methanomassiliicoccaceae archaeon]
MSNMEVMIEYFANAPVPHSMYLWAIVALALCAYSLYKARKMVSEI